jgi:hypothetical protein
VRLQFAVDPTKQIVVRERLAMNIRISKFEFRNSGRAAASTQGLSGNCNGETS